MQQNITLRLEQSLLRSARVLAARRSTSVSGLLRDELRQLVEREEAFEQARRSALADLATGFHLGGCPASRDELHER